MLRELIHLARHAPSVLLLKRKLDQVGLYETVMKRADDAGLTDRRRALAYGLVGDVLEVGCGTGFMFELYPPAARVRAIDVDDTFLEHARARVRPNVEVMLADAQALPFPDASFDAVVSALVFCSIPDAARALAETRRVLRKGGELRMIEHVVSAKPVARTLMHWVDPLWLWINEQGCHMDRDTVARVHTTFGDATVEHFQIFSNGLPAFPMCSIRARKT
jgi:SAM-dependent methyltransferase